MNRYHRQILLPQIGQAGQDRLIAASVLLVGCGALGSVIAEQLVRSGVGYLCVADRDIVEITNLQRQVLFDEEDVRKGMPKAVAAAERLGRINSTVQVEPQVVDVHAGNIEDLLDEGRFDLILDGTDNVEVRFLINDAAVKRGVPWVYGACVGTEGRVMAVWPGKGPCLRCVFPTPPGQGELATCDTAGVLGPVAGVVASLQSVAAIKILSGNAAAVAEEMVVMDLWSGRIRSISISEARRGDCPCCGQRRFEFLDRVDGQGAVGLCGRDAVQIRSPGKRTRVDSEAIARRLETAGEVERTPYFLRCRLRDVEGISLTVFSDGRVIVQGTADAGRARSIAARFVGA